MEEYPDAAMIPEMVIEGLPDESDILRDHPGIDKRSFCPTPHQQ